MGCSCGSSSLGQLVSMVAVSAWGASTCELEAGGVAGKIPPVIDLDSEVCGKGISPEHTNKSSSSVKAVSAKYSTVADRV